MGIYSEVFSDELVRHYCFLFVAKVLGFYVFNDESC